TGRTFPHVGSAESSGKTVQAESPDAMRRWIGGRPFSWRGLRLRPGKAERQALHRARDQEAGSLRGNRGNSAYRKPGRTVVPSARYLDRGRGGGGDRGFHPVRIGSNVFVRLEIMYKTFYN